MTVFSARNNSASRSVGNADCSGDGASRHSLSHQSRRLPARGWRPASLVVARLRSPPRRAARAQPDDREIRTIAARYARRLQWWCTVHIAASWRLTPPAEESVLYGSYRQWRAAAQAKELGEATLASPKQITRKSQIGSFPHRESFIQKRSPAAGQASLPRSLIVSPSRETLPLTWNLRLGRMRVFSRHRIGLLRGVLSRLGPTALEMGARKRRAFLWEAFTGEKAEE